MNFIKIFFSATLLMLVLSMSGCQGNNSDTPVSSETDTTIPVDSETNTTLPPVDINATTDAKFLSIINGNRLTITGTGVSKDIYIMAFNSSGSTNTEGKVTFQYPLEFINKGVFYGLIDPGTATITDGRVHFVYTAPDDLTDVNGTTAEFFFYDTNNSDVNVSLYVDFNLTGDYVSTVPVLKQLVLSDDNLTINQINQVENLTLQAYTDQSTTNINTTLNIKYPQEVIDKHIPIGTLPSTIDIVNGVASFTYKGVVSTEDTVAKMLESGISNPIKANIYDPETGVNVDLNLNFEAPPAIDPKYNNYKLKVYPDNNISITANSQLAVVEAYLEDSSTNLPVANENVIVEFFDASKGTLSSFSSTTDVNGHVAFNYTAPADIAGVNDFNITMKLSADVNVTDSTLIHFDVNGTLKDYTNYKITLVDVNRTITTPFQTEIFDIYLEDNSTGVAKAAEGDVIVVDYFSGIYGTVDSFSAITDTNGHVRFTYTAPADIADINDTNITFRVKNTTDARNSVTSNFKVDDNKATLSKLQLTTSEITLSKNAQTVSINVLAFNGNGEAFDGGFVRVRYPSEITDDNVSGGQFSQSSVAIVNGSATFDFVGPDPLTSDTSSLNFVFVYSEDSDINTTLTINYVPDVPKIVIDDGNFTITKNGEVVTIGITVYDKDNSLYPDGNIKIKYPNSVLNGVDVGSFDSSSVALSNGKASFVYTAANPLDGNSSLVFTFYHDAQPLLSEKDLNITIAPEAGQVVLTNYTLDAIYETSMGLDLTKQMTFFVKDDTGTLLDDANITSMRVTLLNANLGLLEDSVGNTGSSLTVTDKNNVQMNIRSKTLSGVLPIEVYTEFKDANNNDQNRTRVFNIVVLSGPPTAMSLAYAGTTQDSENAKFVENWVLTVTDKYSNLVNTSPSVSLGMLTGYAQSSATTSNVANYLYFDARDGDGNLTNKTPNDTFNSSKEVFENVDLVNDKLVLFGGTGYKFASYGKWDINDIDNNKTLSLKDDYNASDETGLGYAVGHNFRNETCEGNPVLANVYAKDGNNTLGRNGSMIVQVEYNYYLVGKSTILWANLVGENNNTEVKIGIGKKVTLRGDGLEGETYSYAKGYNGVTRLHVHIVDTVEYYKNANFGYAVEVSGDDTNWTISGTSMQQNITSCVDADGHNTGGVAYVDVNITSGAGSAGTITLKNVLVDSEF